MERAPASTTANVASAPSGANVSTPKAARVKARLSSLGDPRVRRAATAALGACAADAASRPLHWVYNMDDMNRHLRSREDCPEFLPESRCPFYSLRTGQNSAYFGVMLSTLRAAAAAAADGADGGQTDKIVCDKLAEDFGPGTEYDFAKREEFKRKKEKGEAEGPFPGRWANSAELRFLDNYKAGIRPCGSPHEKNLDAFCAALILVLEHADDLKRAEGRIRERLQVLTTNEAALAYSLAACRITAKYLTWEGDSPLTASDLAAEVPDFPEVKASLEEVEKKLDVDHAGAVGSFGRACPFPGVLQGALHAMLAGDPGSSYQDLVRKVIRAGGDNCARAVFVGACCSSRGIPDEWIEMTDNAEEVVELAIKASAKA